jgi:hypothetical protein
VGVGDMDEFHLIFVNGILWDVKISKEIFHGAELTIVSSAPI